MFNILHDSIFNQRGLLKQVNRSGWFVFLYLLVMALFMSLGTIFLYIRADNQTLTEENTGCSVVSNEVVCDGANYSMDNLFYMYNLRVYFLDQSMSVSDITNMSATSIVVHGDSIALYVGNMQMGSQAIFSDKFGNLTLTEGLAMFEKIILFAGIISSLIDNLVIILAIALISTLMFLKYKKVIRYLKLFKLAVYGVTPIALLITLYNIIQFNDVWFFILGFIAYLPLFRLNRELFTQVMIRQIKDQENDSDVVESYNQDEIESQIIDDDDDEDQRD